jgi:putative hemolysin
MAGEPDSIMLEIVLILVLMMINAFFAASEMAIVSLNKAKITHLANEGDKKSITLLKLLEEPGKFLATIQVGITLAGFLASASAATGLSKPLAEVLKSAKIPGSDELSLILVTIILSYITLVFGELLPKRVALHNAEAVARFAVNPILVVSKITLPFVKILTLSTNIMIRIFGIKDDSIEEKVSEEEIRMMIDVGEENGVLNQTEKEMIDGIFEFDNTLAKEVMTPRTDVFAIDIDTPIDEIINQVIEEQYSRIPVYEEDIDNVIGILYMKDIFIEMRNKELTIESIRAMLRQPYFVPKTKNIDSLFRELQNTKNHMAVLIDEYGGFSGIVTIEDLIEEIVGNIFDEYDDIKSEDIKPIDAHTFIVDGIVPIDDINETLHVELPSENYDTIGGFVLDLLGSIPKEDEEHIIEYENLIFKIEKVNEKRIEKLKICVSQ